MSHNRRILDRCRRVAPFTPKPSTRPRVPGVEWCVEPGDTYDETAQRYAKGVIRILAATVTLEIDTT